MYPDINKTEDLADYIRDISSITYHFYPVFLSYCSVMKLVAHPVGHKAPKGKKGRKRAEESSQHRRLKGALVLLTNAPASRLSAPQARMLLRVSAGKSS